MLAVVAFILLVHGYSLFSRRLPEVLPENLEPGSDRRHAGVCRARSGIGLYARQLAPLETNAPEYRAASGIPTP